MSTSKKEKISFQNEKAIINVSGQEPREVTPECPLRINHTPAEYEEVIIKGGSIYVSYPDIPGARSMSAAFKVTIQKLNKII